MFFEMPSRPAFHDITRPSNPALAGGVFRLGSPMTEILTSILGRRVGLDEFDNLVVKGRVVNSVTLTSEQFGLVPNTGADLSAQIALAIAFCQPIGATLQFPEGRFKFGSMSCGALGQVYSMLFRGVPNRNVGSDLSTDNSGTVFELTANATGPHFDIEDTDGSFDFEGIAFYGNQANQSDDTARCIRFKDAASPTRSGTLRRCRIERYRGGGIYIGLNRNAGQIHETLVLNCGYQPGGASITGGADGIQFQSCSDWRVFSSDVGACSRNGIYAVGAGTLEIQNTNSFSNLKHGWRADPDCGDTRWIGGSLDRNRESGAVLQGHTQADRGFKHIISKTIFVMNSYDTDNGFADIRLINCAGNVILDKPYFEEDTVTANKVSYNILTEGASTDIILADVQSHGLASYVTAFTNDESRLTRGNAPVRCDGFIMANNATDATNDIDVGAGIALDDTRLLQLKTSATIVKQIDVAFAEYTSPGTASGGRDSADNLTGAKTFNVFMISGFGKPAQPFFSTSLTPTLPTGFTRKRRVGGVYWDGAAIKPFTQDGDEFIWATVHTDLAAGAWGNTAGLTTHSSLPTGVKVVAILRAIFTSSAGTKYARIEDPAVTSAVISSGSATLVSVAGSFNGVAGPLRIKTNASRQTRKISDDASGVGYIATLGWVDPRGA